MPTALAPRVSLHIFKLMSTERGIRAWVEVRASALRRNMEVVRARVGPGPKMIPMVKADGYGLGMARTVTALEPLDPWGYGVATVPEGEALRGLGLEKPVLVLSPVPPGSYDGAVEADLTLAISDLDALRCLQEAAGRRGRRASFHLEVDTGMGRSGLDWRRAGDWGPAVSALASTDGLDWTGCFTHFHSADEVDASSVKTQWSRFQDVLDGLGPRADGLMVHGCNSPAALRFPEYAADAVRPGIFVYGGAAGADCPAPTPAASVRARVVHVHDASPGTTLGYGATYVAGKWERWATVGIGYGDGLPRLLGNRGHALLRGERVPIVGRISMDVTVVDVSGLEEVRVGEVVTFIGRDGPEEVTVDEVAGHARTISYEIFTGLTTRLPRVWLEEGSN